MTNEAEQNELATNADRPRAILSYEKLFEDLEGAEWHDVNGVLTTFLTAGFGHVEVRMFPGKIVWNRFGHRESTLYLTSHDEDAVRRQAVASAMKGQHERMAYAGDETERMIYLLIVMTNEDSACWEIDDKDYWFFRNLEVCPETGTIKYFGMRISTSSSLLDAIRSQMARRVLRNDLAPEPISGKPTIICPVLL